MPETKKKLKNAINENGFFLNMRVNKIEKDNREKEMFDGFSENAIKTGAKIPKGDNILMFKGLASQNFGKGEKNRNGYKIDPKGWDFENYKLNPIILLQHNDEYGGIGHAIAFEPTEAGLNIAFYVDVNTLDEKTKYQVMNGYINAISTGHYTMEDAIEDNDNGDRYSIEDAMEKFGRENVWNALRGSSDILTYVVTKAESVENSLVTIGSNPKAIATLENAIGSYVKNKYEALADEYKEKYSKNNIEEEKEQAIPEAELELAKQENDEEGLPTEDVVETVEENNEQDELVSETKEDEIQEEEVVAKEEVEENSLDTQEEKPTEEIVDEEVVEDAGVTPENKAEIAEGKNGVDTNTPNASEYTKERFEELQNSLKAKEIELNTASLKIAELEKELNEANDLLEKGAETIENQNAIIEKGLRYMEKRGLAYDGTEKEPKKSALERRMKPANIF